MKGMGGGFDLPVGHITSKSNKAGHGGSSNDMPMVISNHHWQKFFHKMKVRNSTDLKHCIILSRLCIQNSLTGGDSSIVE